LIATALFNVEVEGVVTGVDFAAAEPAIKRLSAFVEHLLPRLVPVECSPQKPAGSFKDRSNAACRAPVPMRFSGRIISWEDCIV
jgi:hypothetical protein